MPLRYRASRITSAIAHLRQPLARCVQAIKNSKALKNKNEAADYNRKSFRGLYLPQLSVMRAIYLPTRSISTSTTIKCPYKTALWRFATQVPAPSCVHYLPTIGRQSATPLCPRLAL